MIFEETGTCTFLDWTFTWTTTPATNEEKIINEFPGLVLMDYQQLRFPLRLRTFRPGDRFQPLGMSGTKKLHDFFIDEKIPRSRRPFIPLLLSGDEIIWIAGHRLAESVKVTPQTRCLFKLKAIPLADSSLILQRGSVEIGQDNTASKAKALPAARKNVLIITIFRKIKPLCFSIS